ncbi:MAG: hypothetical protein BZY75_01290 [SAR202 cluster bacterium Io17-Chloro-G7]|nr:MAG: hypothetical protein BZY75_01290 [SAR202 cluster bacterium Io17-Chloro-G7]
MTQDIPRAREDVIVGGSHFVQLEKYQLLNAQNEQFLATLKFQRQTKSMRGLAHRNPRSVSHNP